MKKIISIISALAVTAGITAATAASGAYEDSSKPSLYFTAAETGAAQVLKAGSVYVDTSLTEGKTSVNAELFILDELKYTGQVFVKWYCESDSVKLTGLTDPVTVYGASPYAAFDTPDSMTMSAKPELNMFSISYSTISPFPMELTGERSDSYPLACFTIELDEGIASGSYDIEYMNRDNMYTSIIHRIPSEKNDEYIEYFPSEYSEGLRINVSDRELGDVNNSGIVDAVDASRVLAAYANSSSGKPSGLTDAEAAAADVNGDRMIDAVDASNILAYYVSVSNGGEVGINKFVKGK